MFIFLKNPSDLAFLKDGTVFSQCLKKTLKNLVSLEKYTSICDLTFTI